MRLTAIVCLVRAIDWRGNLFGAAHSVGSVVDGARATLGEMKDTVSTRARKVAESRLKTDEVTEVVKQPAKGRRTLAAVASYATALLAAGTTAVVAASTSAVMPQLFRDKAPPAPAPVPQVPRDAETSAAPKLTGRALLELSVVACALGAVSEPASRLEVITAVALVSSAAPLATIDQASLLRATRRFLSGPTRLVALGRLHPLLGPRLARHWVCAHLALGSAWCRLAGLEPRTGMVPVILHAHCRALPASLPFLLWTRRVPAWPALPCLLISDRPEVPVIGKIRRVRRTPWRPPTAADPDDPLAPIATAFDDDVDTVLLEQDDIPNSLQADVPDSLQDDDEDEDDVEEDTVQFDVRVEEISAPTPEGVRLEEIPAPPQPKGFTIVLSARTGLSVARDPVKDEPRPAPPVVVTANETAPEEEVPPADAPAEPSPPPDEEPVVESVVVEEPAVAEVVIETPVVAEVVIEEPAVVADAAATPEAAPEAAPEVVATPEATPETEHPPVALAAGDASLPMAAPADDLLDAHNPPDDDDDDDLI